MIPLPKPDFKESAREIFEECLSSFGNESLRIGLTGCLEMVEADSRTFKSSFPESILQIREKPSLPVGVTKKDMTNVYEYKFRDDKIIRKKYYDLILSAPRFGTCPICGVNKVKNLDHYMPKSIYYTLAVTPENLIPTCRDCNYEKNARLIRSLYDAPLHPYFDSLGNDVWLTASLQLDKTVLFGVNAPSCWTKTLEARVKEHLRMYRIDELYTIKANEFISDQVDDRWKTLLVDCGKSILLEQLREDCRYAEKKNMNSWEAALCRGLVSQFPVVLGWIG